MKKDIRETLEESVLNSLEGMAKAWDITITPVIESLYTIFTKFISR